MMYFLTTLWRITRLWGSWYPTISSYALDAWLHNSKDPVKKHKPLEIELLSEEVYRY